MPALRSKHNSHSASPIFKKDHRPPRLSIHLPTPQKGSLFNFPVNHNLGDSPISSPCNSPSPRFAFAAPSSQPHFLPQPFPPPAAGPFAIKSHTGFSSSTAVKPRLRKDGQVKRPENAFILFRRHRCLERQKQTTDAAPSNGKSRSKPRQADLSKLISAEWKALPLEERSYWEMMAKEKKEAHEKQYPDYVYRPRKPRSSDAPLSVSWKAENMFSTSPQSSQDSQQDDELPLTPQQHSISIVFPTIDPTAAFDPTMPIELSYQALQIPLVQFDDEPVNSARAAWEQYQASLGCKVLETSRVDVPRPPFTPATPTTPLLTPILESLDSAFSPEEQFSPVPSEQPLYPPPPSDHLASPFQEADKMPTYQTPVHSNWMWAGSPDVLGTPASEDLNTFALSPKELGLFDEIDLGFAGDYSLASQSPAELQ